MGDVSWHFNRSEFACSCGCGFEAADVRLLEILEAIRTEFGHNPVKIHCACRCLKKNRSIGSKDTSQHVKGMAVDFHIDGITPHAIYKYADEFLRETGGVGLYEWGVHIDVRRNKVRWGH